MIDLNSLELIRRSWRHMCMARKECTQLDSFSPSSGLSSCELSSSSSTSSPHATGDEKESPLEYAKFLDILEWCSTDKSYKLIRVLNFECTAKGVVTLIESGQLHSTIRNVSVHRCMFIRTSGCYPPLAKFGFLIGFCNPDSSAESLVSILHLLLLTARTWSCWSSTLRPGEVVQHFIGLEYQDSVKDISMRVEILCEKCCTRKAVLSSSWVVLAARLQATDINVERLNMTCWPASWTPLRPKRENVMLHMAISDLDHNLCNRSNAVTNSGVSSCSVVPISWSVLLVLCVVSGRHVLKGEREIFGFILLVGEPSGAKVQFLHEGVSYMYVGNRMLFLSPFPAVPSM